MNYTYYTPNEENAETTANPVHLKNDWGWAEDIIVVVVKPQGYELTDRDYREIEEMVASD